MLRCDYCSELWPTGQRESGMSKFLKSLQFAVASVAVVTLAGCTGTSTYGTGKTQEAQLLEDLTSIATIGSGEKKKPINYISRPGLVKPPQVAGLPTPAEKVSSQAGYFPVSPEEKRADLLKRIEEAEAKGEELPEDVQQLRKEAAAKSNASGRGRFHTDYVDDTIKSDEAKKSRLAFLKRKAELDGTRGAAPRKYLTEPPKIYRTPEQTAAIGEVGEEEKNPYVKKDNKTNLFDWLRGKD